VTGVEKATVLSSDEAVEVVITPDAAKRAGIRLAEERRRTIGSVLAVPGTVTSNAYRETKMTALLSGIAREVSVELGAEVRRGQPLAVVFSSELADAQMKYLSLRAMIHAHNQKLERTRRLTDIGAASRQELEEVTALAASRGTELAAARQRLDLLGLTATTVDGLTDASQIVSELSVTAPGCSSSLIYRPSGSLPIFMRRTSLRYASDTGSGHGCRFSAHAWPRRLHRSARRHGDAYREGAGGSSQHRESASPRHVRSGDVRSLGCQDGPGGATAGSAVDW
jgi:Barrel-sandwich domain of CusB or HlyD membrane-fusion